MQVTVSPGVFKAFAIKFLLSIQLGENRGRKQARSQLIVICQSQCCFSQRKRNHLTTFYALLKTDLVTKFSLYAPDYLQMTFLILTYFTKDFKRK